MNWRRLTVASLGLLLALILLPPGCGRKTTPVPPQKNEPAAISDLDYRFTDQGVVLSWTTPAQTAAGDELAGVDGFEIRRAVVPEAQDCPGCPLPFESPVRFKGQSPKPGETVSYTEKSLLPGHRYFYKVRTTLGRHLASRDSNLISFAYPEKESSPPPVAEPTP
jgi:uncharacterized protein